MKRIRFNALPLPATVVRAAAEDAAFNALSTYHTAERVLAMPGPKAVSLIHRDVIAAERLATSLAKAVSL